MNDKDLRVIKTKESLERSLIQLLTEKSLDQITIAELCRASGITRRTFYLHYESVQQLFEKLVDRLLIDLEQAMLSHLASRQALKPDFKQLFHHVLEHKPFYDIVFSRDTHFALYDLVYQRIKNIVKNTIKEKITLNDTVDLQIAYRANAILGLILEWKNQNYRLNIDELNKLSIELVLNDMDS